MNNDYCERLTKKKPMEFKFEQGGMLVYDVKAEIIKGGYGNSSFEDENVALVSQFDKALNEDLEIYEKIKQMGPCPTFEPVYKLNTPDDNITLEFNSKFESGNLAKVIKLSDYEYNLTIRSDFYSNGNNHWYYFSVLNPRKTSVTFHITNMKKSDPLYKSGMKPAVFSSYLHRFNETNWHRDCCHITYKPSPNPSYYTLSFTYNFRMEGDLVFFAYSVPYHYTDLQKYLSFVKDSYKSLVRIETLCSSLAGNDCYLLTITENVSSYKKGRNEKLKYARKKKKNDMHNKKKGIVITCRVHSGETVSSFMLEGFVNYLLSDECVAKELRRKFVFKIIPMLNPDGVRYGNYRCSLLGVDLNRRWDNPSKLLHPTIYYSKQLIENLNLRHGVVLFCDLHGHSKKKNAFIYGCSLPTLDIFSQRVNICCKTIPLIMQENKFFSLPDCHFRIEPSKKSTARVVMFKEFNITHSYTMETSFYGPSPSDFFKPNTQMSESDLKSIGASLCKACSAFLCQSSYTNALLQVMNPNFNKKQDFSQFSEDIELDFNKILTLDLWEANSVVNKCETEDSGGSESDPDERVANFCNKRSKSNAKERKIGHQIINSIFQEKVKRLGSRMPRSVLVCDSVGNRGKMQESLKSSPFASAGLKLSKRSERFLKGRLKVKSPGRSDRSILPKILMEAGRMSQNSPSCLNQIDSSWVSTYRHRVLPNVSSNNIHNNFPRYL